MSFEKECIVVIGGANLDIRGRALKEIDWNSSNPAQIKTSPGGVARNIAENLGRLGKKTFLFSAVGDDLTGKQLLEETERSGVIVDRIKICRGKNTGTYLAFLDQSGDLALGMSDMDLLRAIDPGYLESQERIFKQAKMVIADTNLEISALETVGRLREKFGFSLVLETVSVAKAPRAIPLLGANSILATNREEFKAILPGPLETNEELARAGKKILALGVDILLLKMGEKGLYVHSREGIFNFPAEKVKIRDATGAGDSLVAAFVAGFMEGWSLELCSGFAQKVAKITLKAVGSVSPEINRGLMEGVKE